MSVTEEIKARLDIVNFVSQYVQLKKAGRNYKAPCPFHAERTPSFVVFPDSQTWRCFGACGEGGDIFSFAMKKEGLDFASALNFLAEKAGVELHQRSTEQVNQDEKLDKLRGLLQETAQFFHNKLGEPAADYARAYAYKRGLTDDTLKQFMMGYAPDGWRNTLDHMLLIGYAENDIIEAGVAIRSDSGRVYDRFRNRLMIPICDARGQIVGFGARALNPDDNPKYLNSPQTPLFDKGATLFGLHHARRAIRESETAVIVEGYMDAIQAHQKGFTNVVAEMGTALTEPQLRQLSRYARRLILALDPDAAGIKATMRGLEVARQTLGDSELVFDPRGMMRHASKLDMELLVITLPEGQDPDDLIRDDPQAWQKLVDTAQSVADYVINTATGHLKAQSSFGEREQIARQLLPILLATENDLQQHYNVQRLALKLHLDERTLIQWTQQQKRMVSVKPASPKTQQPAKPAAATQSTPAGRVSEPTQKTGAAEGYCLAMLIREPNLLYAANRRLRELAGQAGEGRDALGSLSVEDFVRSDYQMILRTFEKALAQDDQEPVEYLEQHLPYELYMEVASLLVEQMESFKQHLVPSMHAQLEAELEAARKKKEWMTPITGQAELDFIHQVLDLRKQRLKRETDDLRFLLQEADSDSEVEYNRRVKVNQLATQIINQLVNQLARLQREQG